jgi:hypothetical protein
MFVMMSELINTEHYWNVIYKGMSEYLEEKCPSVTFSITNLTLTGPSLRLAVHYEMPATNTYILYIINKIILL